MADTGLTNPFGLIDERVLSQIRRQDALTAFRLRQQQSRSGVEFAAGEIGNAVGKLIGAGLRRTGVIKDKEMERAEQVTSAQERARNVYEGTPDVLKNEDPFERAIEERRLLMQELRNAGLNDEADTVLLQMASMKEQSAKLRKLEAETDSAELQADFDERTQEDRVQVERLQRMREGLATEFDFSTHNTRVLKTQLELEREAEAFGHERVMRPFLQDKAKSDAAIARIEASVGGAAPHLIKLQARRDDILNHLVVNPNDKFAQRNLEEINKAIQSDILNVQRNVDNWQPTSSVLGAIQTDMIALDGFMQQVDSLRNKLESTVDEPFGSLADTRAAIASGINTVGSLVGMPQSLNSAVSEAIVSDDELIVRSEARQLRSDLVNWLKGNSRATSVDVQTAEDLTQAMEDTTDRRTVVISLTNLGEWLSSKQLLLDSTLIQGLQSVSPSQGGEDSEEDATDDLFGTLNTIGGDGS